ncbi:MAG: hypothetical protein ACYDBB_19330 [Armatimonadota bacterium]
MSGLSIRLATRDDDAEIRAVLRRNAMPGAMTLAFAHEPSFFDAIEVEGYDPQVVVGEIDGRLVGAGLVTIRTLFLNGESTEVGYLSSLRADRSIRGTTALVRGYRVFRRLHEAQRRVPFYLSTIMEDNVAARKMLTSGRAGMPAYHEIGRYRTIAIPLLRRRTVQPPAGISIVPGSAVGAEALATFLQQTGRNRQFFPVYTAQDLQQETGILRGIHLDDFCVALAGDTIHGTMAYWNQLPFRQHIVTEYADPLRWLRPGINLATSLLGCRLLPATGEPVRSLLAACIAIRHDDPVVFRALLRQLLHRHAGGEHDFLFVGLSADDPLLSAAGASWHLTLHSRIYAVEWGDGLAAVRAIDGRVPYVELGSL